MISIAFAIAAAATVPSIEGADLQSGFEPRIEVKGLSAKRVVRLHSFRVFESWEPATDGKWKPVPRLVHAWADLRSDRNGHVRLATAVPLAGTYRGADGYGILWSGKREPLVANSMWPEGFKAEALKPGTALLVAVQDGREVARAAIANRPPPNLRSFAVAERRINGHYAAPADGKRHPMLILLHGSEGGDADDAKAQAERFAGQGYAAFALNYFAWDLKGLKGVPNAHVNQPIELLDAVRAWIGRQPESDINRAGLYGHSKGAEYAEVAAVHLPWVRAVAACVPTDSVWEGYGIGDGRNRPVPGLQPPALLSSFSWRGQPLPYIRLGGDRKPYRTNTDFYEMKRRADPVAAQAALIPVEKARAAFLWLGGGRDQTWASGAMAAALDRRMRKAGAGRRSVLRLYPAAGHAICGDGTYPTRVWEDDSTDPRDPDRDAEGRATIDAWRSIKRFFAERLQRR